MCVYIHTVALEKARTRWGLKGERRNEGEPRKAVIANEKSARRSRRRCRRRRSIHRWESDPDDLEGCEGRKKTQEKHVPVTVCFFVLCKRH